MLGNGRKILWGTPKGGTETLLSDIILTVQMQFFKMGATEYRCINENKNDYTFS